MDEKWVNEVTKWKSQMEIVIPQVVDDTAKNTAAIAVLQTANATEEIRTRKVVNAVLRSGEFRVKNWMSIITGVAAIAAIVYGALK